MIIFGKQLFEGEMIAFDDLIPTTRISQIGAASLAVAAAYIANDFDLSRGAVVASVAASLSAGWIFQRHYSRGSRGGFFLDKPRAIRKPKAAVNFDVPMTEFFQKLGGNFENCMVTKHQSSQHTIYIIPNLEPRLVEKQMDKISMMLNVADKDMTFMQNWEKGQSAILVPAPMSQWTNVEFDASALNHDRLQMFFGRGVRGEAFVVDLEDDPFGLAAGMTGSGKTNMIRNGLKSLALSNIKTEIYIMDPKEDAQLSREACHWHSSDIEACVSKLEWLYELGQKRQTKYSAAGCENFFEYQRRIDSSEKAFFVLVDEMADFFEQDLTEELEKGEHPIHKRAKSIITRFIRKRRSSGMFLLCALQDPKADIMSTNVRNQFTYRVSLMVSDSDASKVALGRTGAERLPPKGGMLFKTTERKTPALGRAAII